MLPSHNDLLLPYNTVNFRTTPLVRLHHKVKAMNMLISQNTAKSEITNYLHTKWTTISKYDKAIPRSSQHLSPNTDSPANTDMSHISRVKVIKQSLPSWPMHQVRLLLYSLPAYTLAKLFCLSELSWVELSWVRPPPRSAAPCRYRTTLCCISSSEAAAEHLLCPTAPATIHKSRHSSINYSVHIPTRSQPIYSLFPT